MLYTRPSFTVPAKLIKTSDENWDKAFLSKNEFKEKYGRDKETETK